MYCDTYGEVIDPYKGEHVMGSQEIMGSTVFLKSDMNGAVCVVGMGFDRHAHISSCATQSS